jgi:hypothetical protein
VRSASPSIVPTFDHEVYLVLDEFDKFRVWREADEDGADKEAVIRMIEEGQYNKPIRIVAFNTAEGWSRDVTEDIARELVRRAGRKAEPLSRSAQAFAEWATGEDVPFRLRAE